MNKRLNAHSKIVLTLALVALLPMSAHANITSYTEASSDTGGNDAAPGTTITTGNTSAEVDTETITGDQNQSSSTVHIKTVTNGTTHEENYTTHGGVGVSVTATSSGYQVHTWQQGSTTPQKSRGFMNNFMNWFAKLFHW